jgi:hypothetical protein
VGGVGFYDEGLFSLCVMNVGLLRERFLAKSIQTLASIMCIYFVIVMRKGPSRTCDVCNEMGTFFSENSSYV